MLKLNELTNRANVSFSIEIRTESGCNHNCMDLNMQKKKEKKKEKEEAEQALLEGKNDKHTTFI
jgi:hypothetical protein